MIQINSVNLEKLNDRDRRQFRIKNIGFIFQDFELVDYLNVFDNILHCYRLNPALKLTKEFILVRFNYHRSSLKTSSSLSI